MGRPVVDLSGRHFGKLEVIQFAYVKNGHAYWHCSCACGESAVVRSDALKTQDTCGVDRNHISDRSERFWSHVDKKGMEECWEWAGTRHRQGYGLFSDVTSEGENAGMRYAHIVAYELEVGSVPSGLDLRHSCDNPPCCNPNHLIPGTHQDNMNDKVLRGRMGKVAKLDAEKVLLAKRLIEEGHTQVEVARALKVAPSTISYAVRSKTWRHVQ